LKEETGLEAAEMTFLGTLWVAYGFARQKIHAFLASGLTETGRDPDAEEHDMEVRSVPVAEFERMMLEGTIADVCTVATWGLYLMRKARR
jgi:8-oxo-dGTP pyrophosphatase MutT (NUDIX family)